MNWHKHMMCRLLMGSPGETLVISCQITPFKTFRSQHTKKSNMGPGLLGEAVVSWYRPPGQQDSLGVTSQVHPAGDAVSSMLPWGTYYFALLVWWDFRGRARARVVSNVIHKACGGSKILHEAWEWNEVDWEWSSGQSLRDLQSMTGEWHLPHLQEGKYIHSKAKGKIDILTKIERLTDSKISWPPTIISMCVSEHPIPDFLIWITSSVEILEHGCGEFSQSIILVRYRCLVTRSSVQAAFNFIRKVFNEFRVLCRTLKFFHFNLQPRVLSSGIVQIPHVQIRK